MVWGKCKLCLHDKELQGSHLMPRALYRMARGSGSKGNQDPHVLTAKENKSTSYQLRDYVLCRQCEQLFSENGEVYVMRLVTKRNGQFPLLDMLNAIPTQLKMPKWTAYSAADTPAIDRAKIAYFAISVFWRASVHTWEQESGEKARINLGKKYNEEIRRYLLGEVPVPKNATLLVAVCTDEISQKTFYVPEENEKVKDCSVGFLARGLFFLLRITNKPAPSIRIVRLHPSSIVGVYHVSLLFRQVQIGSNLGGGLALVPSPLLVSQRTRVR
jgi:hypothetical protein